MMRKILGAMAALALFLPFAAVRAQSIPTITLPFSVSADGVTAPLTLSGQNSCVLQFNSIGSNTNVTVQGATASVPTFSNNVTSIGNNGVVTNPSITSYSGAVAGFIAVRLQFSGGTTGTYAGNLVCASSIVGNGTINVDVINPSSAPVQFQPVGSVPITLASPVAVYPNASFPVQCTSGCAGLTDTTGGGIITAVDAVVALPSGNGLPVSGTSTAGSYVALANPGGQSVWNVQIVGNTSTPLYFEKSYDSTNGINGNWYNTNGRQEALIGTYNDSRSATGNGSFGGEIAAATYLRVRAVGSLAGTPAIFISYSGGPKFVTVNGALPAGTNTLGNVTVAPSPGASFSVTCTSGGCPTPLAVQPISGAPTPIPTLAPVNGGAPVSIVGNPCSSGTLVNYAVNTAAAATSQVVAISGSTKVYVCKVVILGGGATNVTLEYGTGTNCATGLAALTGPMPLAAQAGWVEEPGSFPAYITPAGQALCLLNGSAVQVSGSIETVQQ